MAVVQKFQNTQDQLPPARECQMPSSAIRLQSLRRVDYQDAFSIDLRTPSGRDAMDWARALFRPATAKARAVLLAAGLVTGATQSAPCAAPRLGAFSVLHADTDAVCLEALTRVGLVQLVLLRKGASGPVVLATFIQHGGWMGRTLFSIVVRHGHRRAVPLLLERAAALSI